MYLEMESIRLLVGRGCSQFSKALPLPPEPPAPPPLAKDKPHAQAMTSIATLSQPPIPSESPPSLRSMNSTMSIPRRPVGALPTEHSKSASIASTSSADSSSPGFSRSLSNGSDKTKDSLSGIESEADVTPPLPPKDSQRQQQTTTKSPASGFQTSPPRPEIWRRRSVKSDRSIIFPELKLSKSNGSTAGPPLERELPLVPSHLPRSQPQKLLPARPAPPQPEFGGMGNKFSKLKEIAKRGSSDTSEDVQHPNQPSFHSKRLPTPEYLKSDKQHQSKIPQVLSPVSPETPPVDDIPPAVPQKADSRSTSSLTIVPDAVYANTTKLPSSDSRDNSDTLSRPDLLSAHSRNTSETLTITSEPRIMRSPQPQKSYAAAKILTPTPSPPPLTDRSQQASPQTSPIQSPSALTSPAAKLSNQFPNLSTPATPGKIFQGPELSIIHFDCYQNHAQMRNSKNILCPVACMICRKKEMGPRWRCTWCCLGACGRCMQVLTSIPGRNLRICLERIGKRD